MATLIIPESLCHIIHKDDLVAFARDIQKHTHDGVFMNHCLMYAAHQGKLQCVRYLLTAPECKDKVNIKTLSYHNALNDVFWNKPSKEVLTVLHYLITSPELVERPIEPEINLFYLIHSIIDADDVSFLPLILCEELLNSSQIMGNILICACEKRAGNIIAYILEHATYDFSYQMRSKTFHRIMYQLIYSNNISTLQVLSQKQRGLEHLPIEAHNESFGIACDTEQSDMIVFILSLPTKMAPSYLSKTPYNAVWAIQNDLPDVAHAILNKLLSYGLFDVYLHHLSQVKDYCNKNNMDFNHAHQIAYIEQHEEISLHI